jgi:hypothetical protein
MCGRYASFLSAEAIARIFGTVKPLRTSHRLGTSRRRRRAQQLCTLTGSQAIAT